ncbi:hypothetical protein PBRA_003480, partial [Plasmodiophora brassicae]
RSDTCRAGGSQARLTWPPGRPRAVFLVRKRDDDRACRALVEIGTWLQDDRKLLVVVEEADVHRDDKFVGAADRLADVDLVVCLGGDGTLLHVSSLFQGQCCPPVVAFAMGTLGFLTPMNIADARCQLTRVLGANAAEVFTTLRMRLWCDVYRKGSSEPELRYQVLNECLIDRGGNAVLTCLDLFVDGELVTVVQADGIIVSTPTGSTAYSMSAGGSIVAPTVHGILITPVCPHTLSFRPAVIPDSSVVRIRVSDHTRARTACASFDGTHRTPLNPGDEICLSMSAMPIPTVNDRQFNTDWFASIVEKLHWNVRVPCAGGPSAAL